MGTRQSVARSLAVSVTSQAQASSLLIKSLSLCRIQSLCNIVESASHHIPSLPLTNECHNQMYLRIIMQNNTLGPIILL